MLKLKIPLIYFTCFTAPFTLVSRRAVLYYQLVTSNLQMLLKDPMLNNLWPLCQAIPI